MAEPMEQLLDLIFGRWRSQILYAGAALGVFDRLTAEGATSAAAVAPEVGADAALLHRLLSEPCSDWPARRRRRPEFPPDGGWGPLARRSSALVEGDGAARGGAGALRDLEASRGNGSRRPAERFHARVRQGRLRLSRGGEYFIDKMFTNVEHHSAAVEWSRTFNEKDRILREYEFYKFDPDALLIREIRGYYAAPLNAEQARHELVGFDYAGRGYKTLTVP